MMTKTFPLMRSVVRRLPLGDLAVELEHAPPVGTLYIPAVRRAAGRRRRASRGDADAEGWTSRTNYDAVPGSMPA